MVYAMLSNIFSMLSGPRGEKIASVVFFATRPLFFSFLPAEQAPPGFDAIVVLRGITQGLQTALILAVVEITPFPRHWTPRSTEKSQHPGPTELCCWPGDQCLAMAGTDARAHAETHGHRGPGTRYPEMTATSKGLPPSNLAHKQ
jgi:hypothetical protein